MPQEQLNVRDRIIELVIWLLYSTSVGFIAFYSMMLVAWTGLPGQPGTGIDAESVIWHALRVAVLFGLNVWVVVSSWIKLVGAFYWARLIQAGVMTAVNSYAAYHLSCVVFPLIGTPK